MKLFRKIIAIAGMVAVAIVAIQFFAFKIMPDNLGMTMLCINALFSFTALFFEEVAE